MCIEDIKNTWLRRLVVVSVLLVFGLVIGVVGVVEPTLFELKRAYKNLALRKAWAREFNSLVTAIKNAWRGRS